MVFCFGGDGFLIVGGVGGGGVVVLFCDIFCFDGWMVSFLRERDDFGMLDRGLSFEWIGDSGVFGEVGDVRVWIFGDKSFLLIRVNGGMIGKVLVLE